MTFKECGDFQFNKKSVFFAQGINNTWYVMWFTGSRDMDAIETNMK